MYTHDRGRARGRDGRRQGGLERAVRGGACLDGLDQCLRLPAQPGAPETRTAMGVSQALRVAKIKAAPSLSPSHDSASSRD